MEPPLTSKIKELEIRPFPQKEKLVDRDRRGYEPADGIFVDVEGALSPELMNEMKEKAMLTEMQYRRIEPSFDYKFTAYGQGGLFCDNDEPVVVTARHNIQDYHSEDGAFNKFGSAVFEFVDRSGSGMIYDVELKRKNVKGEDFTFDDGDKWDNYDFAMSCPIKERKEETDGKFFEWVTESFGLEPGMKVGMVVKRPKKPRLTWNSTGAIKVKRFPFLNKVVDLLPLVGFEDPELLEIFGRSENVCFYTGEITTSVTQDGRGFKHDINSFQGCSGAIIFLLDKGNEGLVGPENYGKAVGVHAGGTGENGEVANVGFCPDKAN